MVDLPTRLLYPEGYNWDEEAKMKSFDFIKSLQIDTMIILIKQSHRGFNDLRLEDFFTTNTEVLNYRLDIVNDLVENEALYNVFCEAVPMIENIIDLRRVMNDSFSVESALSSIRYLEIYQEIVDLFAEGMKNTVIQSEGLCHFRDGIMGIYEGEEYKNLREELSKMKVNFGSIKSVTMGINLDSNLWVQDAGLISVNEKPFEPGDLINRMSKKHGIGVQTMITPLYVMPRLVHKEALDKVNHSIQESLSIVYSKAIRGFGPVIKRYFNINTAGFASLLDDIRFLTAGVKFILSMKEQGFSMCRPTIAPIEEKKCDLEAVFNPVLACKMPGKMIVSNSFSYDENGRFYLVTGPNHGGKSIFAYSVGMAQALFQLGLFVPAEKAVMSPVTAIFTHFPSSDENNYGKGRLESECARLGEIMEQLSNTDMLIMDETFSSTSGLEAGYIASDVLTGIGVIGCGGIYVTHIHDLSQMVNDYNSHPDNKGKIDNLVALMEDKENGMRSYKISRTTPDGKSYAKGIACQYGLDLETILAKGKK